VASENRGRRIRSRMMLLLGLLLAATVLVVGCGGDDGNDAADDGPFTIGFAIGKSGGYVPFDVATLVTAQYAIDEINKEGGLLGRQIRVISADNKSDPTLSATAGIEMLDQGAEFLVVSCDFDLGGPAASQAQSRGILTFSNCAGSLKFGPSGIGDLAFSMGPAAVADGPLMAEWAFEEGHRKPYVLQEIVNEYQNEFCDSLKTRYTALAGEGSLAGEDSFKASEPSYDAQVTRIRNLSEPPGFIVVCSLPPGMPKMLRQLRAAGFKQPILNGPSADGNYWKEAVPNLSDFYYGALWSTEGDDPSPKINELFDRFETDQGEPMLNSWGLSGYFLIQSWAAAVKKAGTFESKAVAEALEGLREEPTDLGPVSFSENLHHNVDRVYRLMEVQNGESRFVKEITVDEVLLPDGS
jgi:branched-chain amino acid transport system substrate-binding protein